MVSAALGSARAAAARRAAPAPRRARVVCGVVRTGVSEKTDAGACKENFRFDLVGGKQATETLVAKSAGAEFVCHTIERPLGITFEDLGDGLTTVSEVAEGSNAAAFDVRPGDVLRLCTAVLPVKPPVDTMSYYTAPPATIYVPCLFDAEGQSFDAVMAALVSNGEYVDIAGRKEIVPDIQFVLERKSA